MRAVTERDFRMAEYLDANPEDYEFRENDKKIVRKDRWMTGMHQIACACGFSTRSGYEIPDLVKFVEKIAAPVIDWNSADYPPDETQCVDIKLECGSVLTNAYYSSGTGKFSWSGSGYSHRVTAWRDRPQIS